MHDRTSRFRRSFRQGKTVKLLPVAILIPAMLLAGGMHPAAAAVAGTISTVAGGGGLGDGGPPTLSPIGPTAVAVDGNGNLFAVDYAHHRIREISPGRDGVIGAIDSNGTLVDTDDVISSVAGDGIACTAVIFGRACGDGGPALSAALGSPSALAVDPAGNLYFADLQTIIRFVCMQSAPCTVAGNAVSPGTIATIAGTGQPGFKDGPALTAQFAGPSGLAFNSAGNLFIADEHNGRVRELCLQASTCTTYAGSIAPGSILTVAGGGSPSPTNGDGGPGTSAFVFLPIGIAVDGADNVYVSTSTDFSDIRKIANVASDGTITTLVHSGSCTVAAPAAPALCSPQGIALGPGPTSAASLFIANKTNNDVLRLDLGSLTLTNAAGTARTAGVSGDGAAATMAQLNQPLDVAVAPSGQLFVADPANADIREITPTGIIDTVAGVLTATPDPWFGDMPALQATFSLPSAGAGAVADFNGDLYIADTGDSIVRKVSSTGVISTVAGVPYGNPFKGDRGPATKATLAHPQGVALDRSGNLYIADTGEGLIRRVDATTGTITTVAGLVSTTYDKNSCALLTGPTPEQGYNGDGAGTATELDQPTGLAVDQVTGDVYIADTGNALVRKLAPSGALTTVAGSQAADPGYAGDTGPATKAELSAPSGVAVDEAGDLFIADSANGVIRAVNTVGTITTVAGNFNAPAAFSGDRGAATAAALNQPLDVAVDQGSNLYIADTANDALRFVCSVSTGCAEGSLAMTPGEIVTLAGTGGVAGYAGDGSAATAALLSRPAAVAVDASGNVFTADAGNDRIRQVADPVRYTAPTNPRPIPSAPSVAQPAYTVPPCPYQSSGSTGSSGSSGTGAGTDSSSPTPSDHSQASYLLGFERNHALAGGPPAAVSSLGRPTTPGPAPSPSPPGSAARGPGPPVGSNNLRVPSAPLGPWWLALVIVGATLAGAAAALFWRWRTSPKAVFTPPVQDPKDTRDGPRLRSR